MKKKLLILILSCVVLVNSLFSGVLAGETPILSPELISARSAILIDKNSGKIIFEKNAHERVSIASITKIMTMDVIMDAIKSGKVSENDLVNVSPNAESTGGSQVWLRVGEQFTVIELLKTIAIRSANDSCVALAEHIWGSEAVFVEKMNEKVALLQLKNTKFLDTNGLNDDQYSSAYDVSIIAMDTIKNHTEIKKFTSVWIDSFRDGQTMLNNTNMLLKSYTGMYGIKTGTTDKALNCLCTGVERNGTNMISVVLGAETSEKRFSDTVLLLDYGFANFEKVDIAKKDNGPVGSVIVKRTLYGKADAVYKDDLSMILPKGQGSDLKKDITYIENLKAPIEDGQKVGEVVFKDDNDQEVARIDLVIVGGKPKITYFEALKALFSKWLFGSKY